MTKYKDAEVSACPDVSEDMYEYVSAHPEILEDHEVTVSGGRDEENTQKTPEYVRTMDLDVENIYKNYKNTPSTIYKAMDAPYFVGVKLFPKKFIDRC